MNTLEMINANGFEAGMDLIVTKLELNGYVEAAKIIRAEFDSETNLETLKDFAVIMQDNDHIVDVEERMIDVMGEDEYFDLID